MKIIRSLKKIIKEYYQQNNLEQDSLKKQDEEDPKDYEGYCQQNNLEQDSQEVLKQQDKEETQSQSNEIEHLRKEYYALYEELKEKLEKSDTYLVTVLGVFTAIMVTFVGAFAFSSSVFQNMEQSDIHRLIFVILCTAVFIASILRWLFDFLLRICGKETKCFKWWWVGIAICFLVMCYADWTNYYYNTSPCKEKGSLIGYLIHKEDCKSQNTQITTKINR